MLAVAVQAASNRRICSTLDGTRIDEPFSFSHVFSCGYVGQIHVRRGCVPAHATTSSDIREIPEIYAVFIPRLSPHCAEADLHGREAFTYNRSVDFAGRSRDSKPAQTDEPGPPRGRNNRPLFRSRPSHESASWTNGRAGKIMKPSAGPRGLLGAIAKRA